MNKHKKLLFLLIGVVLLLTFSGCSGSSTTEEDISTAYLKSLKDGVIYIRHADYQCNELYCGNTTFESTAAESDTDRIAWYKEDWESIPTMYEGDSVIMYSKDVFSEKFVFERFMDVGYSIGLRGMGVLPSGRIYILTDASENLTYPDGDTDVINDFDISFVTIESLGNVKMRKDVLNGILSDFGTITGLTPFENYPAEIYCGTIKYDYVFKADVRVLGSFETFTTTDYTFDAGRVIEILMPEWANSGYYMINGQGIFRYVKSSDYNDETDFNIPNFTSGSEKTDAPAETGKTDNVQAPDKVNSDNDKQQESKMISYTYDRYYTSAEKKYTHETIEGKSDGTAFAFESKRDTLLYIAIEYIGDGKYTDITAYLESPDGKFYEFTRDDKGMLGVTIDAIPGTYTVNMYDLDTLIPHFIIVELETK